MSPQVEERTTGQFPIVAILPFSRGALLKQPKAPTYCRESSPYSATMLGTDSSAAPSKPTRSPCE
jgi:hypothetical protein